MTRFACLSRRTFAQNDRHVVRAEVSSLLGLCLAAAAALTQRTHLLKLRRFDGTPFVGKYTFVSRISSFDCQNLSNDTVRNHARETEQHAERSRVFVPRNFHTKKKRSSFDMTRCAGVLDCVLSYDIERTFLLFTCMRCHNFHARRLSTTFEALFFAAAVTFSIRSAHHEYAHATTTSPIPNTTTLILCSLEAMLLFPFRFIVPSAA